MYFIVGVRVAYLEALDNLAQLMTIQIIELVLSAATVTSGHHLAYLGKYMFVLRWNTLLEQSRAQELRGIRLPDLIDSVRSLSNFDTVSQALFQDNFDGMISTNALASAAVLAHPVFESVHMAAGLENVLWCQDRTVLQCR